jgi:superfamily I DNA/RNA helicase
MAFAPTAQQADFLDGLVNTTSNLALIARAGCGKTSSILMAVDAIAERFPQSETLVCAFNKAIADEVGKKLKGAGHINWRSVQSSTLHGLGYGLIKFAYQSEVDANKVRDIIRRHQDPVRPSVFDDYASQIAQLVGYAKGAGFGFFHQVRDARAWYDLADHHDVDGFEDESELDDVIEAAQRVYAESLEDTSKVDFDDMILFPLVKNLRVKFGKDFIFVDEAQDLSPARQALARKFIKPHTGRMIVVGDDRQAIYGFSGADARALPNMIRALDATVFPLSVTWRCPKAVVALAQKFVPDLEAAPEAPEGSVSHLAILPKDLGPGDAVLCRNTAPLITAAYGLIRSGKACKVEGREIGKGLKVLATRWKVKTIEAFLNKLEVYQAKETQKALAKDQLSKIEEIEDRCETLREICKACTERQQYSIGDLFAFIDGLFADGAENCIVLATYHRSKGREWDRVFLYEHSTRCPSKAARQPWQKQQEANLAYVAITRAKRDLVFVG